jgi:nucleotide-binding universal stress UspA family protein
MLMNQKTKILIAYDGSSHADAAIDELRRAGLPREAEAVVVCVRQEAMTQEEAQNLAHAASQRALSYFPSWEVRTEVRSGAPAWELIRKANDWRADLLVVGSQGRSALGRLLLGSVSQKVVTEAGCSVRVARNSVREPDAPAQIILGVDGSVYSDAAIEEVARRHWPEGSVVKVVSVVRLPFTPTEETRSLPDSYYSQLKKAETGKAQTAITSAVARLKQSGITQPEIESEIILGDAREQILNEAERWGADLIVLGSRGLGGFKRFLLGSVAQGVAAYAPCSVEIVRSRQTDGAGQQT